LRYKWYTDLEMKILITALKKNKYVKTINLTKNYFTLKSSYMLSNFIMLNTRLQRIYFNGNSVGFEGVIAL
jgi:Ran GTPase-activating protein (RanGAP) involved in mRNA processing and transport